jgi:hypothetical protein
MQFTAQGHGVGLAQRMEALAESEHICLSEHTARLVEGYFHLRDLGRITVKGVSEPVGLFDLEALGSFRTRFDRSRARGLSVFVGRAPEMAALDAALSRERDPGPRGTRRRTREGNPDAPHAGDVARILRDPG